MPQTRQLAAIMFADIMGFTAIMETDEALAMSLRDKFRKKLESTVALHEGRIIKISGDGALCSFNSAGESIRAAMAVQMDMQQEPKVPLRVGIHQADVIFEEGDVHGDGVNIASRLESLAIARSIFVSAKVYDDIKNQKTYKPVLGGMEMSKALPEADQINFLPRIKQPVLMLNGEHDMFFPEKTSQLPMFNFLGTPAADKKILIYKSGHQVPRTEFVKETLSWFDKYLGLVK